MSLNDERMHLERIERLVKRLEDSDAAAWWAREATRLDQLEWFPAKDLPGPEDYVP